MEGGGGGGGLLVATVRGTAARKYLAGPSTLAGVEFFAYCGHWVSAEIPCQTEAWVGLGGGLLALSLRVT